MTDSPNCFALNQAVECRDGDTWRRATIIKLPPWESDGRVISGLVGVRFLHSGEQRDCRWALIRRLGA